MDGLDGPDGPPPQQPPDQGWDDLLRTGPARSRDEVIAETRHLLGLDSARRERYEPGLPDVSGLAEELGLGG